MAISLAGSMVSPSCYAEMPQNSGWSGIQDAAQSDKQFDGYLFGAFEGWDGMLFPNQLPGLRDAVVEQVVSGIYWADSLELVQSLKRLGLIEFFEPNYYVTLFDEPGGGGEINGWPYDALEAGYAKDYSLSGRGIRIGVIDSGVDPTNANLQSANLIQGYSYIQSSADTNDDVYHGTKVIQVICGDHNGLGISGISPNAEIVPLKCFSAEGGGTVKIIIEAIRDAVSLYQCDIINMSWGLKNDSQLLHSELRSAYDAGVLLVAAAGNVTTNYPQGTKIYPAAYQEVISVSAIDSSLRVLSSSQKNDQVFVCAPGGNIPFIDASGNVTGESGTSYASPCVTAELAILMQLAPNLERDALMDAIIERTVDLGESGYDIAYGYGLLRLDKLIGQHWSRFDAMDYDGRTCWSVSGWTVNKGGSRALLSAFDSSGKMIGVRILTTEQNTGYFDHIFIEEDAASYLIAYTDTGFIPISPCDWYIP